LPGGSEQWFACFRAAMTPLFKKSFIKCKLHWPMREKSRRNSRETWRYFNGHSLVYVLYLCLTSAKSFQLEKRRVESLEQKFKSTFRKSGGGGSGDQVAILPEDVRARDAQLTLSMNRYRLQCENLGHVLEECAGKLAGYSIQVCSLSELNSMRRAKELTTTT